MLALKRMLVDAEGRCTCTCWNMSVHSMTCNVAYQMLGGLLVLAAVSGFLGASNRSANLLNISVVVCIMGLLLTFQFIGEVLAHIDALS